MTSLFSTLSFDGNNLLSCMTLDVGHLHSTSYREHMLLSKKEYCRDLGNTIKESNKRLSASTVYYYTSEKCSWYPGEGGGGYLGQFLLCMCDRRTDNYKCEDYLHQVTNTRHRIALTKLRLSNHKLAIETGRYSRPFKKPAERTCPICKIEMEDKYHFLNICPAYQEKRSSLLDYLENEYRIKISRMSPNRIFMFLINPPSGNVRIQKLNASKKGKEKTAK